MNKIYRADYADEEFEILNAASDEIALEEAFRLESVHGILFDLNLLDDEYFELKTIY